MLEVRTKVAQHVAGDVFITYCSFTRRQYGSFRRFLRTLVRARNGEWPSLLASSSRDWQKLSALRDQGLRDQGLGKRRPQVLRPVSQARKRYGSPNTSRAHNKPPSDVRMASTDVHIKKEPKDWHIKEPEDIDTPPPTKQPVTPPAVLPDRPDEPMDIDVTVKHEVGPDRYPDARLELDSSEDDEYEPPHHTMLEDLEAWRKVKWIQRLDYESEEDWQNL